MYYRALPYPGCDTAPRLCVRIFRPTPACVLLPFYSTILRDACGLCQIPRPKAAPRPMPPSHAASRAAVAVDDHLGAPTVGGGCSRDAADLACGPDSEQITLPQGRSSASSLPAKPTHSPTPTPTGSRLAGTGPRPRGASASLGATCTARRSAGPPQGGGGGDAREGVLVVHAMQSSRCRALSRSRRSSSPPPSSWRAPSP